MRGLEVARIFLFFSFVHSGTYYPCALVQWFSIVGDGPDDETGLWMVEPDVHQDGRPCLAVIHLDRSFVQHIYFLPTIHEILSNDHLQCMTLWMNSMNSMSTNLLTIMHLKLHPRYLTTPLFSYYAFDVV